MQTEQELISNFLTAQKAAEEAEDLMEDYFNKTFQPLFDNAVTAEDYINIKRELKKRMPDCIGRDMMTAKLNRKIIALT